MQIPIYQITRGEVSTTTKRAKKDGCFTIRGGTVEVELAPEDKKKEKYDREQEKCAQLLKIREEIIKAVKAEVREELEQQYAQPERA